MEEHPDSSSFMNASVPSNSVRMMVDSFRWCWWTDRGMNAGSCVCWRGLSDSCGSETQWDISGPPCTRLSGQDTIVTNKWCMARAWGLALTLSRLCFNSQLLQLASHWGRKRRVIVNGRTTHFRPPLSPLPLAALSLSLSESHFAQNTRWDLGHSDIQAGQQTDRLRLPLVVSRFGCKSDRWTRIMSDARLLLTTFSWRRHQPDQSPGLGQQGQHINQGRNSSFRFCLVIKVLIRIDDFQTVIGSIARQCWLPGNFD